MRSDLVKPRQRKRRASKLLTMWMRGLVASAIVIVACHRAEVEAGKKGDLPRTGSASVKPAPAPKADQKHASMIMDAQVAALLNADNDALVATFTSDSVVLVPTPRAAHAETTGLLAAIAQLDPHDKLKTAKVTKLVAGSSESAVWWSAEVSFTADSLEASSGTTSTNIRLTELATADSGWKVVAAAFAAIKPPRALADGDPIDAGSTTKAGPLTALATNAEKLDASLASSVVVFGTDKGETAWDVSAAHTLLARWKSLSLVVASKPREVSGKDWSFAIVSVDWLKSKDHAPFRMSALIVGTPSGSGTQVVAAQFTAN